MSSASNNGNPVGKERRHSQRRVGAERREFSRLGDGRWPRRSDKGRRETETLGSQYANLFK